MKKILTLFQIILGNLICAVGISCFLLPAGILGGGTTGIGLVMKTYFGISISTTYAIVNTICFILGFFVLGKKFAMTTLLSSVMLPAMLRVLESIDYLQHLSDDMLLCTVLSGVLIGYGCGIVMKLGSSTGGMDIPPLIIQKYTGIPVGKLILPINALILMIQIPLFNSQQILYGIVSVFFTSYMVDKVQIMGNQQAQLMIFTPHYEELRKALLGMEVGLTMFPVETGYEGKEQKAILCAVPIRRVAKIKAEILRLDPMAFTLVNPTNEILGRGFTLPKY